MKITRKETEYIFKAHKGYGDKQLVERYNTMINRDYVSNSTSKTIWDWIKVLKDENNKKGEDLH